MRIAPISINTNRKQHFGIKFPEEQLNTLIKESEQKFGKEGIPRLSLLLDFFSEIPGKIAEIAKSEKYSLVRPNINLKIDGEVVAAELQHQYPPSGYALLEHFLVGKSTKKTLRMPEQVYNNTWFNHHKVTEQNLSSKYSTKS